MNFGAFRSSVLLIKGVCSMHLHLYEICTDVLLIHYIHKQFKLMFSYKNADCCYQNKDSYSAFNKHRRPTKSVGYFAQRNQLLFP